MPRDFTDYIAEIHGAGDRVYFQEHYRQLKKDAPINEFEFHGRTYPLNKDRAFQVKGYNVWKKWDKKHPLWSIIEVTRAKKVGLIKYREPGPSDPEYKTVNNYAPKEFVCKKCGFTSATVKGIKLHMTKRHKIKTPGKDIRIRFQVTQEKVPFYVPVEPYHISKMHQPSGKMPLNGEIVKEDPDSLLNIITPRLLKVEIEDDTYKKAYKSYKFGNILPITQKWYIWVALAVVAIFAVLFLTGNFDIGGR